jgi:hypothetical protein
MEIIRHLSNEELTDLVIDSDQQSLRQTLEALPGWARTATERNDEFWQDQRAAIRSRISAPQRRPVRRLPMLAGAAAAAMMVLAGMMLDRASVVPTQNAQVDSDHELLVEVERVVHSDGPAALEPAALLAEEMVQQLPAANFPVRKKEPRHEN